MGKRSRETGGEPAAKVVGVDPHKRTLSATVLGGRGGVLARGIPGCQGGRRCEPPGRVLGFGAVPDRHPWPYAAGRRFRPHLEGAATVEYGRLALCADCDARRSEPWQGAGDDSSLKVSDLGSAAWGGAFCMCRDRGLDKGGRCADLREWEYNGSRATTQDSPPTTLQRWDSRSCHPVTSSNSGGEYRCVFVSAEPVGSLQDPGLE
jgi:hypothetical protein